MGRHAIQLMMSWKAWDFLRSERKLSVERAKEVVVHGMQALARRKWRRRARDMGLQLEESS